jgi:3-oxoacyl-[acyl-carrier protein] reductase
VTELRRGCLGVYDLAGRVAVVAGGSGGIGAATAVEKQAAGTPLRVVVHPDDVAVAIIGTITHLRTATGTVITVDGGKHL